mgnify:CR=1 FL=1
MRYPLVLLGLGMAAAGCTVTSLPPAGSRVDGGPVAARGTVTHEAKSQLRLYRDAAGCQSVQTVNRQFRLITVRVPGTKAPRRLVLEESYDIRHCLESESNSSEAVITAWLPDTTSPEPAFRITGRGVTGAPEGAVYRMVAQSCCGSQDLLTYFSLLNGQTLLASSGPVRRLEEITTGQVRLAGFHGTFSTGAPPEVGADSTVVGVLYWADETRQLSRHSLRVDPFDQFALEGLAFVVRGRPSADSLLLIGPDDSTAIELEVRLVSASTERRIQFRVPVHGLALDATRASLPKGIRLSPLP